MDEKLLEEVQSALSRVDQAESSMEAMNIAVAYIEELSFYHKASGWRSKEDIMLDLLPLTVAVLKNMALGSMGAEYKDAYYVAYLYQRLMGKNPMSISDMVINKNDAK